MEQICQISGEPGGNIVVKRSRLLPGIQLFVKEDWWSRGFEPRWVVITYGRSLIDQASGRFNLLSNDESFKRIIERHLYCGSEITMKDLL